MPHTPAQGPALASKTVSLPKRAPAGAYVADLYTSFEDVACVYMVMEYCEGGDLFKTMLMHGGALEEQWVCVEVRGGPRAAMVL